MTNTPSKISITLPSPYEAQKPIIKACLNEEDKFIIFNASRQSGKTLSACIVAIYWALQSKGQHIMIVSPTDSQARKIYKQMIQMLEPIIKFAVKNYKAQSGDSEIAFNNNSVILFRSAASENSLRGYSNSHLILDECAFIKEEVWNTILAPTLTVRGKKVFFCSTPKGKNFFYKLFRRGMDGETGYRSFKLTYESNPYANIDFIKEQQEILPYEIFAQEYLGEFVDQSSIFKNINEVAVNLQQTPKGQRCVIGIDIAFARDFTVAICLDENAKMLDYIRFNKEETPELVSKLSTFIKKWNPAKVIVEENNQGRPVIDLLKQSGVYKMEGFSTTSQSKNEIINDLMVSFAKKEIRILNDDIIKGEFEAFTYTISNTGKISFASAYGHDDVVMATAFAYKALKDIKASTIMFY